MRKNVTYFVKNSVNLNLAFSDAQISSLISYTYPPTFHLVKAQRPRLSPARSPDWPTERRPDGVPWSLSWDVQGPEH